MPYEALSLSMLLAELNWFCFGFIVSNIWTPLNSRSSPLEPSDWSPSQVMWATRPVAEPSGLGVRKLLRVSVSAL